MSNNNDSEALYWCESTCQKQHAPLCHAANMDLYYDLSDLPGLQIRCLLYIILRFVWYRIKQKFILYMILWYIVWIKNQFTLKNYVQYLIDHGYDVLVAWSYVCSSVGIVDLLLRCHPFEFVGNLNNFPLQFVMSLPWLWNVTQKSFEMLSPEPV